MYRAINRIHYLQYFGTRIFFIICNGNPSELCEEQSSDVSTNIAYGLQFKCLMSTYFMPT